MSVRVCAECGSTKRMVGQPEGVTICTTCNGQELHPADRAALAARTSPRFTYMRGIYNTPEELGPGQGRGK